MIREGRYVLGTPKEIAEVIVDASLDFSSTSVRLKDTGFVPYDFGIPETDDNNKPLKQLESLVENWYGVKLLHTGFHAGERIDIFVDGYGGGCGSYCRFLSFYSRKMIISVIAKAIVATLKLGHEVYYKDIELLADICDEE